jgi:hypothetical protein
MSSIASSTVAKALDTTVIASCSRRVVCSESVHGCAGCGVRAPRISTMFGSSPWRFRLSMPLSPTSGLSARVHATLPPRTSGNGREGDRRRRHSRKRRSGSRPDVLARTRTAAAASAADKLRSATSWSAPREASLSRQRLGMVARRGAGGRQDRTEGRFPCPVASASGPHFFRCSLTSPEPAVCSAIAEHGRVEVPRGGTSRRSWALPRAGS